MPGRTILVRITPDETFSPDRTVEGTEVAWCLRQAADVLTGNKWYDAGYSFPVRYQGEEVGYVSIYDKPMIWIDYKDVERVQKLEAALEKARGLLDMAHEQFLPDNDEQLMDHEIEWCDELEELRGEIKELGLEEALLF